MIRLTLKKKILVFAITLVLLIVGCLITGIWGLHQEDIANKKAGSTIKIYDYFQELRILFEQTLMGPHDYTIHANKDEKDIFLRDYEVLLATKDMLKTLIKNQKMRQEPEFEGILSTAEKYLLIIEEKLPEFKMMVLDFFDLKLPEESHRVGFYMEEMDIFIREFGPVLQEAGKALLELSDSTLDQSHKVHMYVLVLLIMFGITAVLAGITLSYYLIRSITGPLDSLIEACRKIKGGDLTTRANVMTRDEIAELAGSFNEMVGELADAQEHISTIFQCSGDAMRVIDNDFNILQVNKQMEQLTGMSIEESVGEKCYEVFHSEDCHSADCTLKRILRGEKRAELESTRETKDGRKIAVELIATPLKKSGKTIGVIESFRDISKRKMAEDALQRAHDELEQRVEERTAELIRTTEQLELELTERMRAKDTLRESEQKYRTLFQDSRDAIYMTSREGEFIDVNRSALDLFNQNREEMIGLDIRKICVNPDDWHCFQKQIERHGSVRDYELKFRRKDGTKMDCLVTSTVHRTDDGGILGYQGIIRDISNQKQLEARLQQAQKMEAIGTLAGGIAHDFNNILQAVSGYVQLLLIKKKAEDPDSHYLKQIYKSAHRAGDLVKQLLIFSRKVESKLRPVDLNHEVAQVAKLLRMTIPKMIDIELNLAKDLKIINADSIQLEQIIMNLALNAKDAMPDGGKLLFETNNVILDQEYCKIHLGATCGEYVLLSTSDTGHGIDKESFDHIFEPFYTTKETGHGTGLGLAMVYGIAKNHGGYITCYSEIGQGTVFKIYFPVLNSKVVEQEIEDAEKADMLGGHEIILLVDDEDAIRDLGRDMLTMYGYTTITAEDGETAIEIYEKEKERISLVILDIGMPGMGGSKCLQELLRIDPEAKVIMASGYMKSGKEKETIESDAAGFIGKPYKLTDMLKKVREVLDNI
ncbi:MAG: PAS domain S-box protein [Desulfobacterales bacterium]|nr:PAS domain S-box protein [Desulfobacterales bacterium]